MNAGVSRTIVRLAAAAFAGMMLGLAAAGCSTLESLPEGTSVQSSTLGLRFSPSSPDGTPFMLGHHSFIVNTPTPADSGPSLNRFEGSSIGTEWKSTVASGPVGEELEKAGGPEALGHLVAPIGATGGVPSLDDVLGDLPAVAQPPDDGG